jgi:hypothetical protein
MLGSSVGGLVLLLKAVQPPVSLNIHIAVANPFFCATVRTSLSQVARSSSCAALKTLNGSTLQGSVYLPCTPNSPNRILEVGTPSLAA